MYHKHLVIIEHKNNIINKSSFGAIAAANQVTSNIDALILAENKSTCLLLSKDIKSLVNNVNFFENKYFKYAISQSYAEAISHVALSMNYNYIWGGSSSFIKEMMPRLTARLTTAGMISDIQKIINKNTFERPMWAGDIISQVQILDKIKIITTRSTDFQKQPLIKDSGSLCEIIHDIQKTKMHFIAFDSIKSDRPSLADASIVVAGGRGLKSSDNFKSLLYPLADILNGAIGASRAICDANWVPNDWQVGQTGKIVAPGLYFAIGISGAIQHVAGMRGSKVIIAINNDEEAPIFQVADYGLIGDAMSIVPDLIKKIKNNKN